MGYKKTLKELRSKVFRMLKDPSMVNFEFDVADINDCINEAQVDIANWTNCISYVHKWSSVAEQEEYNMVDIGGTDEDLAQRTVQVLFKVDDTTWTVMKPRTRKQLDDDHTGWRNADSGTPMYCYIFAKKLGLYPKPDSAYTNGIAWEGYKLPDELTAEDGVCELPAEYHRYIPEHVKHSYTGNINALELLERKLRVLGRENEIRRITRSKTASLKTYSKGYD